MQETDWYNDFIKTAYEYQIISGYGNDKFEPDEKITREQAMIMIDKASNITGLKYEVNTGNSEELYKNFNDFDKAAYWAKASIAKCVNAGIVVGRIDKRLVPKGNITRAEIAVIITKLLQKSELI